MEVTINRQTNKYQSARTCMVDEAGGVSNDSAGASPLGSGAQDSGQNLWETKPDRTLSTEHISAGFPA